MNGSFSRSIMFSDPGEGKKKKKGKKKREDDTVDSPRPPNMPPAYPVSDVREQELFFLRGLSC